MMKKILILSPHQVTYLHTHVNPILPKHALNYYPSQQLILFKYVISKKSEEPTKKIKPSFWKELALEYGYVCLRAGRLKLDCDQILTTRMLHPCGNILLKSILVVHTHFILNRSTANRGTHILCVICDLKLIVPFVTCLSIVAERLTLALIKVWFRWIYLHL